MGKSWQTATSTSTTTTADTKTTINGGSDLKLWTLGAGQYVGDIVWYQAATAAYTAAQSSMCKTFVESSDVGGISEKIWMMPSTHGGLGTFAGVMVPMLKPMPYNFYASGGQNLTLSALTVVTNTAAFRTGAAVQLCTGGGKPVEHFYSTPTNETGLGTAAARVSLGAITINNSGVLRSAAIRLGVQTVTASESFVGYGEIEAPQINDGGGQKITFPVQPLGAGLGTAVEVLQPGDIDSGIDRPFSNPATFTVYFNIEEAQTSAPNGIYTLGYSKTGRN